MAVTYTAFHGDCQEKIVNFIGKRFGLMKCFRLEMCSIILLPDWILSDAGRTLMASPFDYSIPAQKQNLNEERGFPEIREKIVFSRT